MKLASLLILLTSLAAHAESACPKFFACGTYKISTTADDGKEVATTVTVTGKGELAAEFDYADSVAGVASDGLHLATTFGEDGSFTMTTDQGTLYAKGICLEQFCTFAIRPIAKSGIPRDIRYSENGYQLSRFKIRAIDGDRKNSARFILLIQKNELECRRK